MDENNRAVFLWAVTFAVFVLASGSIGLVLVVREQARRNRILSADKRFAQRLLDFQVRLGEIATYDDLREVLAGFLNGYVYGWEIAVIEVGYMGERKSPFLILSSTRPSKGAPSETIEILVGKQDVEGIITITSPAALREQTKLLMISVASYVYTAAARIRSSLKHPLTGLPNRANLEHCLEGEIDRSRRKGHRFTLLVFDLDGFKEVNDDPGLGHEGGDRVLLRVAGLLTLEHRGYDVVSHWGGDEFVVILPETTLEEAELVGEEIRASIEGLEIEGGHQITASIGIVEYPSSAQTTRDLLTIADKAMYQAKGWGKNCIAIHGG